MIKVSKAQAERIEYWVKYVGGKNYPGEYRVFMNPSGVTISTANEGHTNPTLAFIRQDKSVVRHYELI